MPEDTSEENNAADADPPSGSDTSNRREFFAKGACVLTGGVLVAVPVAVGLGSLLAPLGSKGGAGLKVKLATLDDLPADGSPRAYKVVAERSDAWTKYPQTPIGEVLLRKLPDGTVLALRSTCPHAGCGVNFRSGERDFYCPCHHSAFDLDGIRLGGSDNKSPRPLDALDVDADKLAEGEVWVTFVNFRAGIEDKEVVS